MPKLSIYNEMKFPNQLPALKLYPMEDKLVAHRKPFMQIRVLPYGEQLIHVEILCGKLYVIL